METLPQASDELILLRDRIVALESRLEVAKREHQADIDLIGESAIELANTKNWCHEYDEFVDGLNRKLHRALPTRQSNWAVYLNVRVDVETTAQEISDIVATIEAELRYASLSKGDVSDVDITDYEEYG